MLQMANDEPVEESIERIQIAASDFIDGAKTSKAALKEMAGLVLAFPLKQDSDKVQRLEAEVRGLKERLAAANQLSGEIRDSMRAMVAMAKAIGRASGEY